MRGCHEPDVGNAFARISESLDSDSSRERGGRVSFSSEHPPMPVVEVESPSTYRDDKAKKWN